MTATQAIEIIKSNREQYKATQDKYALAKDAWTMISESPLAVLSVNDVENLLENNI